MTSRMTIRRKHCFLMVEAMKRAYADRALFLGDPNTVQNPVARLTSKDYAAQVARHHRSRARDAGERNPRRRQPSIPKAATPRISPSSTASAMQSPTPTRSISAMASASLPMAPASCSTTNSTILPPSRTPECLWARRIPSQCARARQAAAVVDDADDRAQRRQAVPRYRLAGRQPHHHRGAAG